MDTFCIIEVKAQKYVTDLAKREGKNPSYNQTNREIVIPFDVDYINITAYNDNLLKTNN